MTSGGAGLEARLVPNSLKGCDSLHLSAQTKRLLTGAEKLKLKKKHKVTRGLEEFSVNLGQQFENFSEDDAGFLTTAEKQRIMMNALDNIKSHSDQTVPGYTKVQLLTGRAISKYHTSVTHFRQIPFQSQAHNATSPNHSIRK